MIRMEKTINNCYIGGCVLNCAPYLDKVFENIALIGQSFDKYKIIISYDHSSDDSLEIIKRYKSTLPIELLSIKFRSLILENKILPMPEIKFLIGLEMIMMIHIIILL